MGNKGSIIFALGGVHGAVTLALVYMIIDNVSSAQFDMIVLAEMLVIILSMVVPSIVFRFILDHDMSSKEAGKQIQRLRQEMVKEGLAAVEKIYLPEKIRESVVYDLRDQKSANSFADFWHQWAKASRYPEFNEQERELEQRALLWAELKDSTLIWSPKRKIVVTIFLSFTTKFYWQSQFYLTLKMNIKLI
ncbi:hypothetical protein ACLUW2_06565 [Limosilactobacillus balticus]|uniref:hypothetical protein n=1 Tax=Limosilactobacillus balticus TaxID=2759747 RepID=UPI00399475EA